MDKSLFSLTERSYDVVYFGGVAVELNLSFDNILLMFQLFDDATVRENQKPITALHMLVVENSLLAQLDTTQKMDLLKLIFREKLNVELEKDGKKGELESNQLHTDSSPGGEDKDEESSSVPVVDFTIDAERIYSSFLYDYRIDLIEQQGKLLWNQFIALFNNLSDDTQMKIAIKHRTSEIPKKTKENADEVKHARKMKEHYELPQAKAQREAQQLKEFQQQQEARKRAIREMGLAQKANASEQE
ncbi:Gp15 family bacteriophage protein [Bacillus mycoides]|uniref:Gp15 family bacteriophage protein n=1 Tax=Bacillus mycoides TaxID=1405 RepID=UPI001C02CBD1|nr:Gp15 family bacteriophage protein [Bacillus mycoides]QWI52522.1 hypothetical protein EXW56_27065 [Bacillus mycoides]